MVGRCTLVPHANDMIVAAITDNTLAVFNLFPDISSSDLADQRSLRGDDCSSPRLHDCEGSSSIISTPTKMNQLGNGVYWLMWIDQHCIQGEQDARCKMQDARCKIWWCQVSTKVSR